MCPSCQAELTSLEAEVARLRAFCLQLAEHLYLAAEVLAIRAERSRGPRFEYREWEGVTS